MSRATTTTAGRTNLKAVKALIEYNLTSQSRSDCAFYWLASEEEKRLILSLSSEA